MEMPDFRVELGDAPEVLDDALAVRDAVFTREQGFSAPDRDAFDDTARHALLYHAGYPIATGRIYREREDCWRVGRVAVLREFRGLHLGEQLMRLLEADARSRGARALILSAQCYAVPFYERCGFTRTGERHMDEFCEHETMCKDLEAVHQSP